MTDSAAAVESDIASIEQDKALREAGNFALRAEAIDNLQFYIAERITSLLASDRSGEMAALTRHAARAEGRLQAIDNRLFQRLRSDIRAGACRGAELRRLIVGCAGDVSLRNRQDDPRYDCLDTFTDRLLLHNDVPQETIERHADMVAYQPTPARIILSMLDGDATSADDVFYDVGSGLGRVTMLVHLLCAARTKGVEVEPAFCAYARRCATDLNLAPVEFIHADARDVDYSDGTVFFMYTPFRGGMLRDVVQKLRAASLNRPIRLYTYGPCTLEVSQQRWLTRLDQGGYHVHRLGMFTSR